MTVTLSTIGSAGVTVEATPAALPEAGAGGVTIWFRSPHGDRSYTLTGLELYQLQAELDHAHLDAAAGVANGT
jgi:hypothetical protein